MSCTNNVPGYSNFVKLLRDKCNIDNFSIDAHKDFKKVWKHAYLEGKNSPIEDHKDYVTLMNKYAIKGKGKCGFLPCKDIHKHPDYDQEKEKLFGEWAALPISTHPGYDDLMSEYAIKGNTTRDVKTCGYNTGYIPCKFIQQHPDYENEKKKWLKEWTRLPIYRHPQYKSSVDKLLRNLLQKLGQDARCTISGGELDALVDMYGGAPEIIEQFRCPAESYDSNLSKLYSQVVTSPSKPCPPPSIKLHPDYDKLVASITAKAQKEYGCSAESGCDTARKCNDYVPEVRSQETKKCQQKIDCVNRKHQQELSERAEHWKRLQTKFNSACQDEKQLLNEQIEKTNKQLTACKQQLSKCRNMPVNRHPDFSIELRKEQMRLLENIRKEQQQCQSSNVAYGLGQFSGGSACNIEKKNDL